ncbi:hypothetical protein A3Q56_02147 [Intoshia linei]|uniref:Putative sodium-coupled neutral amino acid transporter 11 n=1 Tax=Intoshia linei TaxID=1819745 RepID=A0A177B714_9BILA|nr:hypothetical protein A3Q56_02147 [Intoshia linei]
MANEKTPLCDKLVNKGIVAQDQDMEICKEYKSSTFESVFILMTSIVGSGVLAMPYSLRISGPIYGIFLMIFSAIATSYSLYILIKTSESVKTNSYQELTETAYGKVGFVVISILQFCMPLIAMCSYNVIIGDSMHKIVARLVEGTSAEFLSNRYLLITIFTLFTTMPLSIPKDENIWSTSIQLGIVEALSITSHGDLFENFCITDDFANVSRFIFVVSLTFTYPLECFVCREVLEIIILRLKIMEKIKFWVHIVLTISIIFITVIISFATDCLGVFLEINGAISAVPMIFIFPSIIYMKLYVKKLKDYRNIIPLFLVLFGISISFSSLTMTAIKIWNDESCKHGGDFNYCKDTHEMSTSIVISNVKKDITKEHVKEFCGKYGKIQYITKLVPSMFETNCNICQIKYSTVKECIDALCAMHTIPFLWNRNQPLYIEHLNKGSKHLKKEPEEMGCRKVEKSYEVCSYCNGNKKSIKIPDNVTKYQNIYSNNQTNKNENTNKITTNIKSTCKDQATKSYKEYEYFTDCLPKIEKKDINLKIGSRMHLKPQHIGKNNVVYCSLQDMPEYLMVGDIKHLKRNHKKLRNLFFHDLQIGQKALHVHKATSSSTIASTIISSDECEGYHNRIWILDQCLENWNGVDESRLNYVPSISKINQQIF